jgi:hypothetical protein
MDIIVALIVLCSGVQINNQLRESESVCEIHSDVAIVQEFRKCRFNKLTKETNKIVKEKKL